MPALVSSGRQALEALLRSRNLDRTLRSGEVQADAYASTGISDVDAKLHGGFPRGQLSELVGPRSSGRTNIVHHILAAATARGELTALVDALDSFDPFSAATAHVTLERLLWVRGPSLAHSAMTTAAPHGVLLQTATERALKAFNLILQAGHFGVVILDLADVPAAVVRQLPFTTWLRLQRVLEGGDVAGLLVAEEHFGRSARGVTVQLPRDRPFSALNPES